ncbi:MAG: hypothetical protein ABI706_10100 [Ilumatobacteraceae bacterium]
MGRRSRALRKALVDHVADIDDVEFAELLDPIDPEPEQIEVIDVPVDEVIDEPVEEALPVASRFADAGIDDDRLPVRPVKYRSRRH